MDVERMRTRLLAALETLLSAVEDPDDARVAELRRRGERTVAALRLVGEAVDAGDVEEARGRLLEATVQALAAIDVAEALRAALHEERMRRALEDEGAPELVFDDASEIVFDAPELVFDDPPELWIDHLPPPPPAHPLHYSARHHLRARPTPACG